MLKRLVFVNKYLKNKYENYKIYKILRNFVNFDPGPMFLNKDHPPLIIFI